MEHLVLALTINGNSPSAWPNVRSTGAFCTLFHLEFHGCAFL